MQRRALAAAGLACALVTGHSGAQQGMAETDPQVLDKLAAGQTQAINLSPGGRRDLLAVMKALEASGCQYTPRPGEALPDIFTMTSRLLTDTGGPMVVMLIAAHPAYARTGFYVSAHKCESRQVQTVMRTLFAALMMAPPSPAAPPPEVRQAAHTLSAQRINPWWKTWGAFNPGGRFEAMLGEARVLSCHYQSPTSYGAERYAWFDPPPASSSQLKPLAKGHPAAELGNLRLDTCPRTTAEFDDAKARAR